MQYIPTRTEGWPGHDNPAAFADAIAHIQSLEAQAGIAAVEAQLGSMYGQIATRYEVYPFNPVVMPSGHIMQPSVIKTPMPELPPETADQADQDAFKEQFIAHMKPGHLFFMYDPASIDARQLKPLPIDSASIKKYLGSGDPVPLPGTQDTLAIPSHTGDTGTIRLNGLFLPPLSRFVTLEP
jgi:hypothetical protein